MRMGYSNKIILFILLVLVSCEDAGRKKAQDVLTDIKKGLSPLITVVVQPFEGFPDSDLDYVVKRLKVDFTGPVVVREAVPLPKEAYNRPRSRYYADSLLNFLSRRVGRNEKIVGLTHHDMGKNRDSIPLFGIMGLGKFGDMGFCDECKSYLNKRGWRFP